MERESFSRQLPTETGQFAIGSSTGRAIGICIDAGNWGNGPMAPAIDAGKRGIVPRNFGIDPEALGIDARNWGIVPRNSGVDARGVWH
ncbi:MAG: hypothetical protein ACXW5U_32170 [Thermoanaerobaculia bacterium]